MKSFYSVLNTISSVILVYIELVSAKSVSALKN